MSSKSPEKQAKDHAWNAANRGRIAWHTLKKRAEKQGVPFAFAWQELQAMLEAATHCPALGIRLSHQPGMGGGMHSPTFDRRKAALGYVPGNVTVISMKANYIKSSASADEIRRVADWMDATDRD